MITKALETFKKTKNNEIAMILASGIEEIIRSVDFLTLELDSILLVLDYCKSLKQSTIISLSEDILKYHTVDIVCLLRCFKYRNKTEMANVYRHFKIENHDVPKTIHDLKIDGFGKAFDGRMNNMEDKIRKLDQKIALIESNELNDIFRHIESILKRINAVETLVNEKLCNNTSRISIENINGISTSNANSIENSSIISINRRSILKQPSQKNEQKKSYEVKFPDDFIDQDSESQHDSHALDQNAYTNVGKDEQTDSIQTKNEVENNEYSPKNESNIDDRTETEVSQQINVSKDQDINIFKYIKRDDTKGLLYILKNHSNKLIKRNQKNETPLQYACKLGNYKCAKLLIDHGSDVNEKVLAKIHFFNMIFVLIIILRTHFLL